MTDALNIEIVGIDELRSRIAQAPERYRIIRFEGVNDSLDELRRSVPPYPPELPNQRYIRTEDLGRSLGSGFGGGFQSGTPDIWLVRSQGSAHIGEYGSRVEYASFVIGEGSQAEIHQGR